MSIITQARMVTNTAASPIREGHSANVISVQALSVVAALFANMDGRNTSASSVMAHRCALMVFKKAGVCIALKKGNDLPDCVNMVVKHGGLVGSANKTWVPLNPERGKDCLNKRIVFIVKVICQFVINADAPKKPGSAAVQL
jgi:hypothetical protein